MGFPFKEEFACEIDEKCQKVLKHNFKSLNNQNTFADIFEDVDKLPPVEFLTAGFPCPTFREGIISGN